MNRFLLSGALSAFACLPVPSPASAHATLAITEAAPDAPYRGTVQINHGCSGSPTTAVRVTIPDGVLAVRPMPKPGWTLAVTRGPYGKAYPLYGKMVPDGVREIVWSAGSLPDEFFDEFVFTARIAGDHPPGSVLRFPVVQDCHDGSRRWVESPAAGQTVRDLKSPAPSVRIIAASAAAPEPAAAASLRAGALVIEAPWARATPGGAKVAGGYLRVTNTGTEADRLVGFSSAVAGRGEVHEMAVTDGIMRMRPLDRGLDIAPSATVELKPGGFHLMFMDLRSGLTEGETVRATLVFEKAGPVEIGFKVGPVGSQAAPAAAGHSHH